MTNLSILQRVALVALLPLSALAGLLAWDLDEDLRTLAAVDDAAHAGAALPQIAAFTHGMQAERGMSAGYIASGRAPALQGNLATRRKATDKAAREMSAAFETLEAETPGAMRNPAVLAALDAHGRLDRLRRDVDAGAALPDVLKAYTASVTGLRDGVTDFARGVDAPAFRERIMGLSMQLALSEYAGLERAVGASAVAAGGFSEAQFLRFAALSQNQSGAADMIAAWSAPEIAAAVQAAMGSEEAQVVEALRARLLRGGGAIPEGFPDAASWFEHATARIARLGEAEHLTLEGINESAEALRAGLIADMMFEIGLMAAGVLILAFAVWWGARSVARPVGLLAERARTLAFGHLAEVPFLDHRNEIGDLARAVTEFNRMVTVSMRNASALECASSSLMIANDTFDIVFVNQRLEDSLLKSTEHFKKTNPDIDFGSLRGLNIDIFHENPAATRERLMALTGVHRTEISFDDRRFNLAVVPIEREGKRLGYVVEWADVTAARQTQDQISDVLSRIRRGDFSGRVKVESEEEFLLAVRDGINQIGADMGDFMQDMQRAVSAGAEGDLTDRMSEDRQGELAKLAGDLNGMFETLRGLVAGIKDRAETLAGVSGDVLDTSRDLSERAESQAAALTETAQAMTALTENMAANRARVSDVRGAAETAGRQANEGRQVVQSAVDAVTRMEASTARVKDFTGLIDEIAFQTNLLALNAAVEAARAGEAGKGFAVVATEVRSLAQRASEASREIGEVIAESAAHAEEGVTLVSRTGETIGALLDAVEKVSVTMGEVDAAIENQTSGIAEMDMAVKDVDAITQQNTELAQHAARSAERLAEQSEGLTGEADRFRTDGAAGAAIAKAEASGAEAA